MAVKLQTQLFDAFLGEQEGIHSIILPDLFSSGGSKNVFIDKYGRAKKIDGYAALNSAVTTNTGASATLVRGLFAYNRTEGGSTTRQLVGVFDDGSNEWEIWYSNDNGVNWTFSTDLGAGSVGFIPDFAQFGDTLYITNGVMTVRSWNGTTLSVAGRTQSPTPTSAEGATGALIGTYKYKLLNRYSDGSSGAGSDASDALSVQDKKITLSWTADADTDVVGYDIYRTSGTGEVYYFVDYSDDRTVVAYTDNTQDLDILENRVMEEHGDPPPTGVYFAEPHKQRVWYGRTDTYPTRVWWSDPGLAEDVNLNAYLDFSDSETTGDVVTGMFGNYEGRLIVFTDKAVWAVSGTGQVTGNVLDWNRIRTNAHTGCVSHRSAVRIPAGAKYPDQNGKMQLTDVETIAYFTPLGDIRIFDGDNDIIISHPKKDDLQTFSFGSRHKVFAIPDGQRGEISWVYPGSGQNEPTTAVTWNYKWGVWYTREWGFSSVAIMDTSTEAQVLVAGSNSTTTGGKVFELWSGNSFAGSNINAVWMTKTLYGVNQQQQPALSNTKRWRWLDLLFETEGNTTITVEWLTGHAPDNASAYGTALVSPASHFIFTSDGEIIFTTDAESILVSQATTVVRAIMKGTGSDYLHDEGVRIRISDNAALGSWALEGMQLAYQILPGLQRRMQG